MGVGMGENNSKLNNWQRINLQNLQPAHEVQYQKKEQPNKKVGKISKQMFLQRRHTDANKHMKNYSASFIIREMHNKTTVSYYLTSVRMTIIKKSTNNTC